MSGLNWGSPDGLPLCGALLCMRDLGQVSISKRVTAFIRDRNALGGHERMLNVDERLKADYRAVNPKPIKGALGRRG